VCDTGDAQLLPQEIIGIIAVIIPFITDYMYHKKIK
jgi:hypothetical protein